MLTVLLFWVDLYSLMLAFVLQWSSLHLGTLYLSRFGFTFYHFPFLLIDPAQDIFNLGAATATTEFCELVKVTTEVYIPHQKYQVKAIGLLSFQLSCSLKSLFFFFSKKISLLCLRPCSVK